MSRPKVRRGQSLLRCAAALACTATLAACSSATAPGSTIVPAPATGSSSPAPRMSVPESAAAAALAAYRGMWQDFVEAGRTSDWRSPALGRHATGVALTNLARGLYTDHYNGLVTRGEPVLNPTVASSDPEEDPTTVVTSDCGDSTHWLKYRADTGKPADATPGGRRAITAVVSKQADGTWKVSDFGVHEVGSC